MNTRIKQIRDSVNLTQDAFGKRIGSARNTIANYETGNRVPSNAVIKSICKEFKVNEDWLKTGDGEMFLPKSIEDELSDLTLTLLADEPESFRNRLVKALANLSIEEWEVLEKLFRAVSEQ